MDSSTIELDNLLNIVRTKDNGISSQKELNHIQNKALNEVTSNLRNRDYQTYLGYLIQFLSMESETEWNLNNQFHIDVIEFVETILKVMDTSMYSKLREDLRINDIIDEKEFDLFTIPTLSIFMKTSTKDNELDNLNILRYYCSLKENYNNDSDYSKNVYLKKVSLLENYMNSLKANNKDEILKLVSFIEKKFINIAIDENSSSEKEEEYYDFIGKKCYLSSLALSVITKDYYNKFDLKLLFLDYDLVTLIKDYKIIEFNLVIQFYTQFFITTSKRKSLYKFVKETGMNKKIADLLDILTNADDFSLIESYSKSYIFQIISKVSILDNKLLFDLFQKNQIDLSSKSEYTYLLDFYSFLDPGFILKYYKKDIKLLFKVDYFVERVYSYVSVMRNICSNEELWSFVIEPIISICKRTLPLLEILVLLDKFSQYEHCLLTLLRQETWMFQYLYGELLDEELVVLKENILNNLIIKHGEFVRETNPEMHKKLKEYVFGNDREAKVSVATMTK
ncbi:hypothetical protein FOG51_00878 [Hanseniaspora uvarum]|nr:hypothetical protein FOG51_00878 [Hanseniaspora uvarum]